MYCPKLKLEERAKPVGQFSSKFLRFVALSTRRSFDWEAPCPFASFIICITSTEGGAGVALPMRLDVVELIAFMLKIVTVAVTKAVATMIEIWRILLSHQR